jgi:hypothetical protein
VNVNFTSEEMPMKDRSEPTPSWSSSLNGDNQYAQACTPDNTGMLLTEHQVGTMAWTHSSDINPVKGNALKLARIARPVAVVLTASMEDRIQGPLVAELEQINSLVEHKPIANRKICEK